MSSGDPMPSVPSSHWQKLLQVSHSACLVSKVERYGLPMKIFLFSSRRRELTNVKRTQVPRSPESWVPACKAEWEPDHHVSRPARHTCNA